MTLFSKSLSLFWSTVGLIHHWTFIISRQIIKYIWSYSHPTQQSVGHISYICLVIVILHSSPLLLGQIELRQCSLCKPRCYWQTKGRRQLDQLHRPVRGARTLTRRQEVLQQLLAKAGKAHRKRRDNKVILLIQIEPFVFDLSLKNYLCKWTSSETECLILLVWK